MADVHEHDHEHDERQRVLAVKEEGVHRASEHEGPFSLHVLSIGGTGAGVLADLIKNRPTDFLDNPDIRFTGLAVDIGDQDLGQVIDAAKGLASERAEVRTVALDIPTSDDLLGSLNRYREFLKMEFPRYYWNPNYEPWLPADIKMPAAGEPIPRAVAKAIYGADYYQHGRVEQAIDEFVQSVNASATTPIVVVVFGLADTTGSGIVVELARHLSSIKLGRRPWVVGIGIMPSEADPDGATPAAFFPVINELDCMIDAEKNKGVMAVWGDLYKNPFTGGFFVVPQDDVHAITKDASATREYVNEGIGQFLTRDNSVHLYETLKALNWLGVSAETWHPAIRGEPSDHWVNVLTWRRLADARSLTDLGLAGVPSTEYSELRVFRAGKAPTDKETKALNAALGQAVSSSVDPGILHFDTDEAEGINVVVPRLTKLELGAFVPSRDAYDKLEWDDKLMRHSWLLDLGVMLCEPSIRFEGMGGECIWGCACWVVVPHAAIRGEVPQEAAAAG